MKKLTDIAIPAGLVGCVVFAIAVYRNADGVAVSGLVTSMLVLLVSTVLWLGTE